MARPSGPLGNSPRDVRDDAVGVPADNVDAPEPPRWPPKPKRVTGNTFHAKVSGGTPPKRADRKPHFRRGGFVKGFASGGSIGDKQDQLPGEDKNDPTAPQNLKKAKGGTVGKAGRFQGGGQVKEKIPDDWRRLGPEPPPPPPREEPKPGFLEREFEKGQRVFGPKRPDRLNAGGKLSAAQRQSLPKSDFALPGAGKGPKGAGSGSYPIPDRSHAANALARSSGKPVAAAVRAKVKAKYPDMGEK
jgi:hypothetical protein